MELFKRKTERMAQKRSRYTNQGLRKHLFPLIRLSAKQGRKRMQGHSKNILIIDGLKNLRKKHSVQNAI